MSRSLSFKQALLVWEEQKLSPDQLWPHLSEDELELTSITDSAKRAQLLDHLSICRLCAERYRRRQAIKAQAADEVWDLVVLSAAAGEKPAFPLTIVSQKNYYKIDIMQNTVGREDGLAVLTILDPGMAARHEGTRLWVCDASGRNLLRGIVTKGEVWQKVARLNEFDYSELLVYVAEDPEPIP